jgi:hypothetical protein
MAPDNNDLVSTRERLEFLLDNDRHIQPQPQSTRQAFLAGAALSGLLAGSLFLTQYIDGKLQPSATEGSSASASVDAVAAARTAGVKTPAAFGAAHPDFIRNTTPIPSPSPRPNGVLQSYDAVQPGVIPQPNVLPQPNLMPQPNAASQQNTLPERLMPIAGFSTSRSVITGVADAQTLTASYYWTFTLKNTTSSSQEAQMNIVLPDGAVVSRATLWINGKAEEAAFNSTEAVQNAYDWIVVRHRDPLIITQANDHQISLKASPVMPNKEMKIRIGMTVPMTMNADGTTQMLMPHISDANLDTSCVQNIHITSDSPMFSNDTHMSQAQQKKGFLLRGNLADADLTNLQIKMTRSDNATTRFATRATHSFPPSFILAEVKNDEQGLRRLTLNKVITRPNCPIITDDHAAFRLSYLWAKEEINRLIADNDRSQAVELATIYRVVSPVSGAVVLERQSDYDYNGLDRNRYKSTSYVSRDKQQSAQDAYRATDDGFEAQLREPQSSAAVSEAEKSMAPQAVAKPPAASPSPVPQGENLGYFGGTSAGGFAPGSNLTPMPRSAASGDSAPRARRKADRKSESRAMIQNKVASDWKATSSHPQTPHSDKIAEKKSGLIPPPPADSFGSIDEGRTVSKSVTTLSGTTDAPPLHSGQNMIAPNHANNNLIKLAGPVAVWLQHTNTLSGNTAFATALLLSCLGVTFAGGLGLLAIAFLRFCQHRKGVAQFAAAGTTWMLMAMLWPLFSQVTFVVFSIAYLTQTGWKTLKLPTLWK